MIPRYWLLVFAAIAITCSLKAQDLFPKQQDGRFGYIDTLDQWVIPAQFDHAGFYVRKKAIASRNDSLFLVINKDLILYLPGLKNYSELGPDHFAVQHKNGRWAVADNHFKPLTGFDYTKIAYGDSMFTVWKNSGIGLLDNKCREVFPCKYAAIEALGNGQFKVRSGAQESVYVRHDTMVMIIRNACIVFSRWHPKIFQSFNKKRTRAVIYNLKGDSIYACNKCSVVRSFGNYILVQQNEKISMLDARTGELKNTLGNISEIVIEPRTPSFLYLRSKGELYLEDQDKALYNSSDSIDLLSYVNAKYLFLHRYGKWGMYDFKGNMIIPCRYDRLDLNNDSLLEAIDGNRKDIYYMPLLKKIMTVLPGTYLSVDETSILAYNENGISKLYEINSELDLTDSAEFKSLTMIRAGKKTQSVSTSRINLINPNNNINLNTSRTNRWFYSREHYGLLGFNGDTLLRPRYTSIHAIDDSTDIVVSRTASRKMRIVQGSGLCNVNFIYGILNNRTAKYIVAPQYYYLDYTQFADTSMSVVKVINRTGNFALMNKLDYSIVDGSECTYITEQEDGYMRLFYQARFFCTANQPEKKTGKTPQFLCISSRFWKYGETEDMASGDRVYIVSSAVNIADRKGRICWDWQRANKLSFVDEGRYGNFIGIDHKNLYGVMSASKDLLVPLQYSFISRLTRDDRYFVLKTGNVKYGYVTEQGVELSEALFHTAYNFRDEYAWCKLGDSMVLINKSGDIIETGLPRLQVNDVSEGYTSYRTRNGWVLMDVEGNQVGTKPFKKLQPFINGAAAAMQGGWGLIDANADWLVKPGFEAFACENKNTVVFLSDNQYHFYNRQGAFIHKLKAKGRIRPLGSHYFIMEQNGSGKIFHENGEPFKNRKYRQEIRCINDTVLTVANSSMVMYTSEGKRIHRYGNYGGARAIDRGMLKLERNRQRETGITLMITESQRQLHGDVFADSVKYVSLVKPAVRGLPMQLLNLHLDECFRYNAFIYHYERDNYHSYCLADSLGNLLNEQTFYELKYFGNGLFKASFINQNGIHVTGILNYFGLWVVEPKFNDIKPFHSGVAIYSKQSDFRIADENGRLICHDVLVDYSYQDGYYCLKTEDKMAWWHPQKGWLTGFSK